VAIAEMSIGMKLRMVFKVLAAYLKKPSASFFSAVEQEYLQQIDCYPRHSDAIRNLLFRHYMDYGKFAEARDLAEASHLHRLRKAKSALLLGMMYFYLDAYDKAIECLEGYDRLKGKSIYVYYLGYSLVKTDRYAEAISVLQMYTARRPRDYRGHALLGHAYCMQREYDSSLAAYRRAENIEPGKREILSTIQSLAGLQSTRGRLPDICQNQ